MEKSYLIRITTVDDQGQEMTSTLPYKSENADFIAEDIEQDMDAQYPHLKHKVTSIEELKTPEAVENWNHSYLGTLFGVNEKTEKTEPDEGPGSAV
jgi:hypothetical protein